MLTFTQTFETQNCIDTCFKVMEYLRVTNRSVRPVFSLLHSSDFIPLKGLAVFFPHTSPCNILFFKFTHDRVSTSSRWMYFCIKILTQ